MIGDRAVRRQLLTHFHELAGSVYEALLMLLDQGLWADRGGGQQERGQQRRHRHERRDTRKADVPATVYSAHGLFSP